MAVKLSCVRWVTKRFATCAKLFLLDSLEISSPNLWAPSADGTSFPLHWGCGWSNKSHRGGKQKHVISGGWHTVHSDWLGQRFAAVRPQLDIILGKHPCKKLEFKSKSYQKVFPVEGILLPWLKCRGTEHGKNSPVKVGVENCMIWAHRLGKASRERFHTICYKCSWGSYRIRKSDWLCRKTD